MLVIHGGKDYRLTEAEGLATFTALQRQGIPSELLYFPDENHWVLKPMNSIVRTCKSRLSTGLVRV
jgi:dipeptidyl aminopeptidase/acylaminoacyl peptidase